MQLFSQQGHCGTRKISIYYQISVQGHKGTNTLKDSISGHQNDSYFSQKHIDPCLNYLTGTAAGIRCNKQGYILNAKLLA